MFRGLGLGLLLATKMSLIFDLTHFQESMDHDNVQMKSMVLVSLMHIKDEVSCCKASKHEIYILSIRQSEADRLICQKTGDLIESPPPTTTCRQGAFFEL